MTRNMPISPGAPVTWLPERDAELTELVATDKLTFEQIGNRMGISKGSAIGRFYRIAARMEGRVQG